MRVLITLFMWFRNKHRFANRESLDLEFTISGIYYYAIAEIFQGMLHKNPNLTSNTNFKNKDSDISTNSAKFHLFDHLKLQMCWQHPV